MDHIFPDDLPITYAATSYRDYIDYLKWNDLEQPIMKGVDVYGRPFYAMRIQLNDPNLSQHHRETVLVLFQRYIDNSNIWCFSYGRSIRDYSGYLRPSKAEYALCDYFYSHLHHISSDDPRLNKLKRLIDGLDDSLKIE